MTKQVLGICSILAVLLFIPVQDITVSASTVNDVEEELKELEKEQSELQKERGNIENEKGSTEDKMDENKSEQTVVEDQIHVINEKLTTTIDAISDKETDIATIKAEITTLGEEIEELDEDIDELIQRIKDRDILLKSRLVSIQENGGPSQYMEVLFGSQSFSDFISRSSAVNKIMDQDIQIMEEQTTDKNSLEGKLVQVKENKVAVEDKKEEEELQKEELVTLKVTLDEQVDEKEVLMSKLEVEFEELDEFKLTLEEEEKIVQEQQASIAKAREVAESEKTRLNQLAKEEEARQKKAEEERKKQVEEERIRVAEEQKKAKEKEVEVATETEKKSGASSSSSADNSAPTAPSKPTAPTAPTAPSAPSAPPEPTPPVTTVTPDNVGTFIWPTTSRGVTSPYGQRVHPVTGQVGKMHHGIDLGVYRQSVLSSASGVVFSTSPKSGYGNTVLITHIINGATYTTLYAHLESVSVSPGQVVTQGDRIGTSGNTGGSSTGHHLHFEIHKGLWNAAKSNSTNPLNYLP